MKNLKQLLIDRKYLEAKRIVLDSKKNLEQNVDILLECVEDSRTPIMLCEPTPEQNELLLKIIKERDNNPYHHSLSVFDGEKIESITHKIDTISWNDQKKPTEIVDDINNAIIYIRNATGEELDKIGLLYSQPTNEESEAYTWKQFLPTPALPPKETDKDCLEKWKELLPIKDFTPVGKLGKVTTSFRDHPCTLNKAAKIIEKCTIADDCKHGVDNPDCEKCRGLGVYDRT